MALDSRSKRASSVGIALAFLLAPPLPDGTIAQGDRQHIAWSYSGISTAVALLPDVLHTSAVSLVPLRNAVSLVSERHAQSLVPVRTATAIDGD